MDIISEHAHNLLQSLPVIPSWFKGFLLLDWAHDRNRESIEYMASTMQVPVYPIPNVEALTQSPWVDQWYLVFCFKQVLPNGVYPNKFIISGPHLYAHELPVEPVHHCVFNVLCDWNLQIFQHVRPDNTYICAPFPLNTQTDWVPTSDPIGERQVIVVYYKFRTPQFQETCTRLLQDWATSQNYTVKVFVYGKYDRSTWKQTLMTEARFVVFAIGTESQGFAVQECMALNVPAIILDIHHFYEVEPMDTNFRSYPHEILNGCGATTWSISACGPHIQNLEELSQALEEIQSNLQTYTPRSFYISHFNLTTCLERLWTPFLSIVQ